MTFIKMTLFALAIAFSVDAALSHEDDELAELEPIMNEPDNTNHERVANIFREFFEILKTQRPPIRNFEELEAVMQMQYAQNGHDGEEKMQNRDNQPRQREQTRLARAETNPPTLETAQYRCDVCLCDGFTEDEITKLDVCEHYLCTVCMKNTIEDNINNGRWEMTCHYVGEVKGKKIEQCTRRITDAEVGRIASPERYSVYQTKVRELQLERDGAIRCPNPDFPGGCPNWVYPQDGTTRRECLLCNYAFCFNEDCRVAVDDSSESDERKMQDERPENVRIVTRYAEWGPFQEHAQKTCEQFQLTSVQGTGNCKQCPGLNGQSRCPTMISHDLGGCNHMRCDTCKHNFCWTCRKPHNPGEVNAFGSHIGCHSSRCETEKIYTGLNF